jgi:hypothetical protein
LRLEHETCNETVAVVDEPALQGSEVDEVSARASTPVVVVSSERAQANALRAWTGATIRALSSLHRMFDSNNGRVTLRNDLQVVPVGILLALRFVIRRKHQRGVPEAKFVASRCCFAPTLSRREGIAHTETEHAENEIRENVEHG